MEKKIFMGNDFKELIETNIKIDTTQVLNKVKTLWTGSSNSQITLSDRVDSFDYVIVYFTALNRKCSIIINGDGSWNYTVSSPGNHSGFYALRLQGLFFTVSGNKITPSTIGASYVGDIRSNNTISFSDGIGNATITKVVGYK